jgi:hypothetical protein
MFIQFQTDDIVPNQQETVTRAMFSNNVGNLTTFFSSSAQTATQKTYYYEVFNSASTAPTAEAQFSVAFGHRFGSGSEGEGGQVDDTPSRAIYSQYRQLCLDAGVRSFTNNGVNSDYIYVVNFNRARLKDGIDEGNIELNLHHLSGSEFINGVGYNAAHTGSNVQLGASTALRLVDDSKIANATVTSAGEVYNIVSGSIENGVYNATSPHYYGKIFPRLGVVVLDGAKLDLSASFGTVTGSDIPGDNAYKLFTSMSGSAAFLNDGSGDTLGMSARSKEYVKSTHYFVRARASQFNFSNNPSFVTGSDGDLAISDFINDPKVYITTVGLYDEDKNLLAVAKASKPIQKSFRKETLIEVKLDY